MVDTPRVPPFCFITFSRVPEMRAPEQPNGWPRAMAPPCRLTFSFILSSSLRSFSTGRAWAAKASLSSTKSISSMVRPARLSAFLVDGTGP
ncbi:hypothetical protein D9M71_761930 [compost metagenome]